MGTRPEDTRSQDAVFVHDCNLTALRERLPLDWPTPAETRPSPKRRYRSHYQYQGWNELEDLAYWEKCDDFDLLLRLVDFSGLRDVLAEQLGWTSAKGKVPFDPVSLFLLTLWQVVNAWSRAETLRNLRKVRFQDDAIRFGFRNGVFPTEGGLRHFLTALGKNSDIQAAYVAVEQGEQVIEVSLQQLTQLIAQSVALVRESAVLKFANELHPRIEQPATCGTPPTIRMMRRMAKASSATAACRFNWQIQTAVSASPCWMMSSLPTGGKKCLQVHCYSSWQRTIRT